MPNANGMDAPVQKRHRCAKVEVSSQPLKARGTPIIKITTIGIDLAKSMFAALDVK